MTTMKPNDPTSESSARESGQSIVELALFIPIFLIMIIGLLEVSQIVITQNRVTTASRNAARFGANGGEDDGMVLVALNTITQTLNTDEDRWDIWTVRGVVNPDGNGFVDGTWAFEHAFGISNTKRFSNVVEADVQARVLEYMRTNQFGENSNPGNIAADENIVGTYMLHDPQTLVGIEALPSINALSVMRVASGQAEQTNGCSAFPIAVSQAARSLNEETFPSGFSYPPNPPNFASYTSHVDGQPLDNTATEGTLFRLEPRDYSLVVWNVGITNDDATLANAMTWPGNSQDYTNHGDAGLPLGDFEYVVRGYLEPGDATDTGLHRGDWIAQSNGSLGAIAGVLNGHIDAERVLRLPVFGPSDGFQRQVVGFANFRPLGYGGDGWLLMELVSWDDSCGIVVPTT